DLGCRERSAPSSSGTRIVSLAPAVTETIFALGAGKLLVGVSDYCDFPSEARRLPHLGTSLTPNYEAIARAAPTLIVSEANGGARRTELEALAPTLLLPWLTLSEVCASIVTLGKHVGQPAAGEALAAKMQSRLGVPEPKTGPRVLLVLGYEPGKLDDIWFIRQDSLHGAALNAAGGRNAVGAAVAGAPRLSQERVLELDPDMIFILLRPGEESRAPAYVADWQRLSGLGAVKHERVRAIAAAEAFADGPRILNLVDRLAHEIHELEALR
ncbi:MAG TPA: helical backbone metal receptor, partial [Polyangiaceae bacterium]|nr:helical backbone metal receptor [Polyangiaceae bacterium]